MTEAGFLRLSRGLCALAMLTVVVSRLPGLDFSAWHVDEAFNVVIADMIRDGAIPYRDVVDHRGPATYYVFAFVRAVSAAFGVDSLVLLRSTLIAMVVGLTAGVWTIARRSFGAAAAAAATLVFAGVSSAGQFDEMIAFHTEWTVTAVTLPAALLTLSAVQRNGSARYGQLGLAGVLFGIGFLAKQSAALEAAAAGLFVTVGWVVDSSTSISARKALAAWARDAAAMLSGFVAVLGIAVGALAAHDALGDAWFWFWRYNTEYYGPAYPMTERTGLLGIPFLPVRYPLATTLTALALGALAVWRRQALSAWFTAAWREHRTAFFVGGWLLGAFVGAALSGRTFPHYLIPVYAPLALAAGFVLSRMEADLIPDDAPRRRLAMRIVPVIGLAALMVYAYRPPVGLPNEDLSVGPLVHDAWLSMRSHNPVDARPTIAQSIEIVREVREVLQNVSGPDDPIFVWGLAADFYIDPGRKMATRFVYCTMVAGIIPHKYRVPVEGSWEMLAADWKARPPKVVIDTSPGGLEGFDSRFEPTTFGATAELMRDYELVRTVNRGTAPYIRIFTRVSRTAAGP